MLYYSWAMNMIDWLIVNRDWVFSGAGIAIASVVLSLLFKGRNKPSSSYTTKTTLKNKGKNSTLIGGDVNVTHNSKDNQ